jgi:hypothetical protein
MMALAALETAAAWTLKVALAAPAGTVTDVGMVTFADPLAKPNATLTALVAVDAKVTVQLAVAGGVSGAGVQANLLGWFACVIVTVPPLPTAARLAAAGVAALAPVI